MFQNNPALRKSFLKIGAWSSLTGLLLTFMSLGTFLAKYILIAVTTVSIIVLFFWILDILGKHKIPSTKIIEKGKIAFSTVILFLSIQFFLVGIVGGQIFRYHEHAAMEYCETVGRAAEEYKTLNGEYPNQKVLRAAIEIPRPRLIILDNDYVSGYSITAEEGPYCLFTYLKENIFGSKVFIIPNKKWVVHVHR